MTPQVACNTLQGANSTVGQYIISIAKQKGVKTVNIVRDRPDWQETVDALTNLGADLVATPETVQQKAKDAALEPVLGFNCVGGEVTATMAQMLKRGGTLVTYGAMTREPVIADAPVFIFQDVALKGFWLSGMLEAKGPGAFMDMLTRCACGALNALCAMC